MSKVEGEIALSEANSAFAEKEAVLRAKITSLLLSKTGFAHEDDHDARGTPRVQFCLPACSGGVNGRLQQLYYYFTCASGSVGWQPEYIY